MKLRYCIIAVVLLLLGMLVEGTNFNTCIDINASGNYYLTGNIVNSGDDYCINITASNVLVEGYSYLIDSDGTADYGIYIWEKKVSNITIDRGVYRDWDVNAMKIRNVDGLKITSVTLSVNDAGINIFNSNVTINNITSKCYWQDTCFSVSLDSSNVTFENSTLGSGGYGIALTDTVGAKIRNVTMKNMSKRGLWCYGCTSSDITRNTFRNTTYAITLWNGGSTPNYIYNNIFNVSSVLEVTGTEYTNYWNKSSTDTRIKVGGTAWCGLGNYYADLTGTGLSETSTCETKKVLSTKNIDYHVIPYTGYQTCTTKTNDTDTVDFNDMSSCTSNATVKITAGATDPVDFTIRIAKNYPGEQVQCPYICDYCEDIKITNASNYCELNITWSPEVSGEVMTVSVETGLRGSNIPAALAGTALATIIVIIEYTVLTKSRGWS